MVDPEHFRAVLQSAQDDALPLDGWVDPKDTSGLSGSDDAVEAVLAEHGDDEHAPVADPIPLGTLVRDAVAYINSGAKPEVLPTPFADLNALLDGGLRRGEITFIAAKTGIGKSAIALQIAVEVARHRYPVLLANFEMANRAVVQRILAQQARVSATGLRRNIVEPEDLERIRFTAPALAALPLVMTDAARTVRHLAKLVAARADTDPFALLVVDYLQVLAGPKSIRERRLQIDYINRALRRLAIKYHVAVLCVSSMRRLGKDEVPDLSALKESGDIEFGADCVIVLAREFQQHNATARILKQRHGREGEVDLVFDWQHVRFEEG
ncbi:MAG TPA: DnaB-like helicase C-terminal domain-containing protein [Methylomirabilota bacterium]|nr:DnaB-like helicase C-terminal domain-containing protein [Methylomirabilota bacterium]